VKGQGWQRAGGVRRTKREGSVLILLETGADRLRGPAMIAYIGELAVKRKKWLDQPTSRLVSPSPNRSGGHCYAVCGLCRAQGARHSGALASYVGFGLPAFLFMVTLSALYAASRDLPWVTSLFHGLQVVWSLSSQMPTYAFGRGTFADILGLFL